MENSLAYVDIPVLGSKKILLVIIKAQFVHQEEITFKEQDQADLLECPHKNVNTERVSNNSKD